MAEKVFSLNELTGNTQKKGGMIIYLRCKNDESFLYRHAAVTAAKSRTCIQQIRFVMFTDHVALCSLQGTGDGCGAALGHVLSQTLFYVPMKLLKQKPKHN